MSLLRFELKKMVENKALLGIIGFAILFVGFLFALNRAMYVQVRQDLFDDLDQKMERISQEMDVLIFSLEKGRYVGSKEETETQLAYAQQVARTLADAEEALRANDNERYLSQLLLYQENVFTYREEGGHLSFSHREFQANDLHYPALLEGGYHYEDSTYSTNPANFLVIFLSLLFHPLGLSLFVIVIGLLFSMEYDNHTIRFILVESDSRVKWLRISYGLNFLLFLLILFVSTALAMGIAFAWNNPLIGSHVNDFHVPVEVFGETGLLVTAQEKAVQLVLVGIPLFLLLFSVFYLAIVLTKSSIKGLLLYAIVVGTGAAVTEGSAPFKQAWNPFSYFDHSWVSAHDSYPFIGRGVALLVLASGCLFYLTQRRLVRKPL